MLTFLTPRLEKIFPFGGLPCLELAFSAPRIENFFLFGGLNVVLCQLGSPTREMILIFRGPPASEVALHYPRGRPSPTTPEVAQSSSWRASSYSIDRWPSNTSSYKHEMCLAAYRSKKSPGTASPCPGLITISMNL